MLFLCVKKGPSGVFNLSLMLVTSDDVLFCKNTYCTLDPGSAGPQARY